MKNAYIVSKVVNWQCRRKGGRYEKWDRGGVGCGLEERGWGKVEGKGEGRYEKWGLGGAGSR